MSVKLRQIIVSSYPYILSVFCFIIPVLPNFAPLASGVFFLFWLLEGNFKNRFELLRTERFRLWFILPALFLALHCIRLPFSSNDMDYELFDIQTKLFLVVFPILFSTLPLQLFSKKNIEKYFISFIFGFLTFIMYAFVRAIILYFSKDSIGIHHFFYSYLSAFMHPSYASMFGVSALLFCFYLKQFIEKKEIKWFLNISVWIISVFILLLFSRTGIITFSLLLISYVVYCLWIRKGFIHPIILIIAMGLTGVLISQKSEIVKARINDTVQSLQKQENGQKQNTMQEFKQVNPRIVVWKASIAGISDHFWFGVGSGAVKETLFIESQKIDENSEEGGHLLNSHNQFLQTFLALGIFGFLTLLACFVVPFIIGIKYKDVFLIFFAIITGFNNLLESMQERHVGNLFFGFFFCFFVLACFMKQKDRRKVKIR